VDQPGAKGNGATLHVGSTRLSPVLDLQYFTGGNLTDPPYFTHCDMDTRGGGWTRVASFDFATDACPGDWQKVEGQGVCSRNAFSVDALSRSAVLSNGPLRIRQVQVSAELYQYGSPNAFGEVASDATADDVITAGLSFSVGQPKLRHHLFSYAVAVGGVDSSSWDSSSLCPDLGGASAPAFMGENYACATANQQDDWAPQWYETPLFQEETYFLETDELHTGLLEARIQGAQITTNEDIGVRHLDVYVSSAHACTLYAEACDDGNSCTLDICVPGEGCQHSNEPVGASCNDGDSNTKDDICNDDGECQGWHYVDLSYTGEMACAVTSQGEMKCWGAENNDYGQLSPPDEYFVSVDGNDLSFCGVTISGDYRCWGELTVTTGNTDPSLEFVSIAIGAIHACALTVAGGIVCTGANGDGQASPPPMKFSVVSAGAYHTCGIADSQDAHCWGFASGYGDSVQEGPFTHLSSGACHNCALTTGGQVKCWGWDEDYDTVICKNRGQVSDAPTGGGYVSVHSEESTSCAIHSSGALTCWGEANYPGLFSDMPESTFKQVSPGAEAICGLTDAGAVECWGNPDTFGLLTPP